MKDFLEKLFSKEWFTKVANFIEDQLYSNEPNEVKAQKAVEFGMSVIEELEANLVSLLPVPLQWVGKIVTKLDDKVQRNLVILLVEAIYRGVKVSHERMVARGLVTLDDLNRIVETKELPPAAAFTMEDVMGVAKNLAALTKAKK